MQKFKNTCARILSKPKKAIGVTLAIAILIGALFLVIQNKHRTAMFAHISNNTTSATTITSGQDLTLAFPVGGRIQSVSVKIGDKVKAGQTLASLDSQNALGAVSQANGAYLAAQNNYAKLIAGSTETDIQIAQVALTNAKNNYDNTVSSQKVLVTNALSNLHNSGLTALPTMTNVVIPSSPTISGTYANNEEGTYTITVYPTQSGYYFTYTGLETGKATVGTVAIPLGTRGLYIQFPQNFNLGSNSIWTITIPNTQSSTYLASYNAYQSALQTQAQTIATAQGTVDTAQANLNQKVAGTRSEDLQIAQAQVESTKGALQIAQGNYNNTVITAPVDGTIANVSITAGQIATPNTPVIELISSH
ncbi:MAG: biotin/lipoyl-binding protein [bacterium]